MITNVQELTALCSNAVLYIYIYINACVCVFVRVSALARVCVYWNQFINYTTSNHSPGNRRNKSYAL